MTDVRLSRAVPLDQLREPQTDVRDHRPQEAVQSLANSMGNPDVGQLQDVLVHPVDHADLDDGLDRDDLDQLFRDGHPMRIVDGETRRLAARRLGWETLSATIVPEPPEETTLAQLDANTERVEMSQFETVRALYEHREETGATLAQMSQKTGYSESYLSSVFALFDSPDWLLEAWRHPDHPVETSHARAVRSMLSEESVDQYRQAGDLDDETARETAVEDAKLMVDVQGKRELAVSDFRDRCRRCQKETLDSLKDDRSLDQKQDDGATQSAEEAVRDHTPREEETEQCLVCGSEATRKFALPVCREDYGMLSDKQARGEPLISSEPQGSTPPDHPPDPSSHSEDAVQALVEDKGLSPDQARTVLDQLDQATPPTGDQAHDD